MAVKGLQGCSGKPRLVNDQSVRAIRLSSVVCHLLSSSSGCQTALRLRRINTMQWSCGMVTKYGVHGSVQSRSVTNAHAIRIPGSHIGSDRCNVIEDICDPLGVRFCTFHYRYETDLHDSGIIRHGVSFGLVSVVAERATSLVRSSILKRTMVRWTGCGP